MIVPFVGSDAELAAVCARLEALERRDGDELIVADNRPGAVARTVGAVSVVAAGERRSSYFARQQGAARAVGEWLVFVDADCEPSAGLLDAYLDPAPGDGVGVLAGAIADRVVTDTLIARYIASRRKLDQATTLTHPRAPYAQTANCAVRRTAFDAVGGFGGPVLSGGDADLCWRVQDAGHALEPRPAALVGHANRTTLRALLTQLRKHGTGMQWLETRYPGSFPRPRVRELVAGRALHYGRAAWRAVGEERTYALVDLLALYARDVGRLRANGDPTRARHP